MSAFGWLTKGRCEVSLLDGIVFVSELGLTIVGVVVIYAAFNRFKK